MSNETPSSPEQTPVSQPVTADRLTTTNTDGNKNGLAIASFVTGILALLLGLTFLGFLLGIAAIVLGIISLKKVDNKTLPIIGIITGAIGTLVSIIVTIIAIITLVGVGVGVSEIDKQVTELNETRQSLIDSKKDFAVGETAVFAHFEVKVDKVTRNHVPENEFQRAEEGKELIVVSLSTKNISDEEEYVSAYDFDVIANGVSSSASYLSVAPSYEGGDVQAGATTSGNVVYEIPVGATNLKLKYSTFETGEELTYTLAI